MNDISLQVYLQGRMMCYIFVIFVVYSSSVLAQFDPCFNYTALSDSSMIIDYQANTSLCKSDSQRGGWHRFVSTSSGLIVTTCPEPTRCGCDQQIWMNDSLPSQENGTSDVQFCIRTTEGCCGRQSIMKVKNCGSYIVFQGLLRANQRICFENSSVALPQSTTTTSLTPATSRATDIVTGVISSKTSAIYPIFSDPSTPKNTVSTGTHRTRSGYSSESQHFYGNATEIIELGANTKQKSALISSTSGEITDLYSTPGSLSYPYWLLFGILIGVGSTLLAVLIVAIVFKQFREWKRKKSRVQSTESILNSVYQSDKNAKTKFNLRTDNSKT